mmetsp:Transcript_24759/g.58030  ORF Transcript_24759/g.58030 Transcript_24759/m.58030 type:complete len:400 (-) Transcript_24759:36-1235(-)
MPNFAKPALLLMACSALCAANQWEVLDDVQLPKALSDNTATATPTGQILVAGGCDAPNGNTFIDAEGNQLDFFICESISDELYAFDPVEGSFTTLAKLPRPRYRHAAVYAGGKLWLVGGRNVPDDAVIGEVDVYDPETNSWSTPGSIPSTRLTSDNGAFTNADESQVYVVGGYNPFYSNPDALTNLFTIDVARALNTDSPSIVIGDKRPMQTQRGDIHAVTDSKGAKAYVTGGFSMYPCSPLKSVEVYDIEADSWSYTGDLSSARGDKALVELGNKIYAVGGETSHKDQCSENPDDVPPLSAQSVAVDAVEVLLPNKKNWSVVASIPNFRFRFSAASHPASGKIYTFGGQDAFDSDCNCFPTSDTVVAYQVGGGSSPGVVVKGTASIVVSAVVGIALVF